HMPYARGRTGRRQRCALQARHTQRRESRGRIPPGELGLQHDSIVAPGAEAIFSAERTSGGQHHIVSVHESAGGTAASLDLNDRRRRRGDDVGEVIREGGEFGCHAGIVTETTALADHPNGYDTERMVWKDVAQRFSAASAGLKACATIVA